MPTPAIPKSFIADTVALPAGAPKSFTPDSSGGTARYQIPDAKKPLPVVETRQAKIARLQAEADASKKASDKENSVLGFAGNFGKALVKNIAPSEVGLGETVGKIFAPPVNVEGFNRLSSQQTVLAKTIREKAARGEDTTKLKQIFNSNQDTLDEHQKQIEAHNASLPTTGEVAGQLGGTALDVLSAGSYGKSAAGLETGKLGRTAIPSAVKVVTPLGEKTGLFSLKGAERVAQGAGTGYAYDVTQGLQGNRGEDRSGGNAFIPGTGTLVGGAIPAALELDKTLHNVVPGITDKFSREGYVKDRETAVQGLIDSGVTTKKLDSKITAKGNKAAQVIASNDAFVPEINKGIISSDRAINNVQEQASPMAAIVRAVVESDNKHVSIDELQQQALKEVEDLKLRGDEYNRVRSNILADFASYREHYGVGENKNIIPLSVVDDIKKAKYSDINWNNPDMLSADRAIARAGRKTIENSIEDVDVRALNAELGKLYDAQDMLIAMNGRAVKNGKLGSHFIRLMGTVIGSSHGPAGSIGGGMAAGRLADFMQTSTFDNPIFKKVVGEIQTENPAIFAEAERIVAERAKAAGSRLALPAPSYIPMAAPKQVQEPAQVFTDYGKYREATGVPLPTPDPLALPTGRGGGGLPIQIPARLPSSVDAAEAARRASGEIKAPIHVYGNANDFMGLPKGAVNDKLVPPPAPVIGAVEKAVVGSPQAVSDAIARHVAESQQVLDNLDAATLAKNGGLPALLERTKTNIVDDLKSEGANDVAQAISQLGTEAYASLDDFANAVRAIIGK